MDSLIICLLACCIIMALVWCWAHKIKNASVVDIFWSYNFPVIGSILFFMADGFPTRKLLICGMVVIAGLRLGTHLLTRILSHLDEEDGRYKQLRAEWAPNAEKKFFWFFQAQALSNILLAIPFFLSAANTHTQISPLEYAGAALWVISVTGEATADKQLQTFKKNNKGKVCNAGLWRYSRHPNYFFEWLMWVSYAVFALASPYGYLGIISPLIILYLLLRVTGIPATEEQSLRSKGDAYKAYQQTTSAFIPWFPKNNKHVVR
jgi:steroid 5-alpha reductase family enzyme